MTVAPDDVLGFWFAGHDPDDPATGEHQGALWWGHGEQTDQEVRERFGSTHAAAASGRLSAWAKTPPGRLALVLVLDQVSRNLHRGTPQAFAQDPAAEGLVLDALGRGEDLELPFFHRVFLYMPLMHTEDIRGQERGCRVFDDLARTCAPPLRAKAESYRSYAQRHRDIVARFGRFPHRNAFLGRPSSAEELRFLEQPGSSF